MKIIVDMAGGFGNQLFCYCFGYALSREKKAEFVIDTSMQDNGIARKLDILNLKVVYDKRISYLYKRDIINRAVINKVIKRRAIGWRTKFYRERAATKYEPEVFCVDRDTYFKGNWQTEKYFVKYREELLTLLTPVKERPKGVKIILNRVTEEKSVAVHVRRGDYLQINGVLPMDYYERALGLICDKTGNDLSLYIFSDDLDYCRDYFKQHESRFHITYTQYESDNTTLDDLLIMSKCRHIITANSSYSWWAAWLNQNPHKIVICPEWGMWSGDFYPEEWEKIPILPLSP
ncbi:MAG: alpha-1,2-fucosyltransferase [Lachnospiraceae bacterium]|jgi:hypothetical protein|nr:alpha-1,2-fucosyltransferase [Lachnospiraceae bacterium]